MYLHFKMATRVNLQCRDVSKTRLKLEVSLELQTCRNGTNSKQVGLLIISAIKIGIFLGGISQNKVYPLDDKNVSIEKQFTAYNYTQQNTFCKTKSAPWYLYFVR